MSPKISFETLIKTKEDTNRRLSLYKRLIKEEEITLKTNNSNTNTNTNNSSKDIDQQTLESLISLLNADFDSTNVEIKAASMKVSELVSKHVQDALFNHFCESEDTIGNELCNKVIKTRIKTLIQTQNVDETFLKLVSKQQIVPAITNSLRELLSSKSLDQLDKKSCIKFVTKILVPLIFRNDTDDTTCAHCIEIALVFIEYVNLTDCTSAEQNDCIEQIERVYVKKVEELRDKVSNTWYRAWILIVRLCNIKIHTLIGLANKLLRIVEMAFRNSVSIEQRIQAYDCWHELIDNWSLDMERMCMPKKLKLLVTPMKARFSRNNQALLKRFDTFRYLVERMGPRGVLCLKDFLEFCFGSVNNGDEIEKNGGTRSVRNYDVNVYRGGTRVLLNFLGHDHDFGEECVMERNNDNPLINDSNFLDFFGHILNATIESCLSIHEWSRSNQDSKEQATILCLWKAIVALMNSNENKQKCAIEFNLMFNSIPKRIEDNENEQKTTGVFLQYLINNLDASEEYSSLISVAFFLLARWSPQNNLVNVKMIENYVVSKHHRNEHFQEIALKYFDNDPKWCNVTSLCNLLVMCNIDFGHFRGFIWSIQHLHQFKDLDDLKEKWSMMYMQLDTDKKKTLLSEVEKVFTENPLIKENILIILKLVHGLKNNIEPDLVSTILSVISSILTFPNVSISDLMLMLFIIDFSDTNNEEIIDKINSILSDILKANKKGNVLLSVICEKIRSIPINQQMHFINKHPKIEEFLRNDSKLKNTESALTHSNTGQVKSLRLNKLANLTPEEKNRKRLSSREIESTTTPPSRKRGRPKKSFTTTSTTLLDEKSSDFVKIDTPIVVQKEMLSEHQKEVMKRRREDIPALYQDLTNQSEASQEMFKTTSDVHSLEDGQQKIVDDVNTSTAKAMTTNTTNKRKFQKSINKVTSQGKQREIRLKITKFLIKPPKKPVRLSEPLLDKTPTKVSGERRRKSTNDIDATLQQNIKNDLRINFEQSSTSGGDDKTLDSTKTLVQENNTIKSPDSNIDTNDTNSTNYGLRRKTKVTYSMRRSRKKRSSSPSFSLSPSQKSTECETSMTKISSIAKGTLSPKEIVKLLSVSVVVDNTLPPELSGDNTITVKEEQMSGSETLAETETVNGDTLIRTTSTSPSSSPQETQTDEAMVKDEIGRNLIDTVSVANVDNGGASQTSDRIATSPIMCDTPERNTKLVHDTSDISPIRDDGSEEVVVNNKTTGSAVASLHNNEIEVQPQPSRSSKLLQMVNVATPTNNNYSIPANHRRRTSKNFSLLRNSFGKNFRRNSLTIPSSPSSLSSAVVVDENSVLTFSREIPSPLKAPSGSILKRKCPDNDDTLLTPNSKRKRVNFPDPEITQKKIYHLDNNNFDNSDVDNGTINNKQQPETHQEDDSCEIVNVEDDKVPDEIEEQITNLISLAKNLGVSSSLLKNKIEAKLDAKINEVSLDIFTVSNTEKTVNTDKMDSENMHKLLVEWIAKNGEEEFAKLTASLNLKNQWYKTGSYDDDDFSEILEKLTTNLSAEEMKYEFYAKLLEETNKKLPPSKAFETINKLLQKFVVADRNQ